MAVSGVRHEVQPTTPIAEDIEVAEIVIMAHVRKLLGMGVPIDVISDRLRTKYGKEHWWWKQRGRRDQDE